MGKQKGRGWYCGSYNWDCHNCCCRVCTARFCPYQHAIEGPYQHRCAKCIRGDFEHRICIDCDFFENRNTVPLRMKVVKRVHRKSELEIKVDAIMKKLGVEISEKDKKY